jgi:hypothetical protein
VIILTKPYLLIAGDNYYPSAYTDDWIACYETKEEAQEKWEEISSKSKYRYDWYEIVDLRKWMEDTTFDTFGTTGLIGDPQ